MGGFLNLVARLGMDASGYTLGWKRAQSQTKVFAKEIKSQLAQAFGTAALLAFSKKIIDTADNLVDMADKLGVTTKELQQWQHAAKRSGAEASHVERFFEAITESRQRAMDGNQEAIESYQELGLSVFKLGQMRVPDIGRKVAEAFKTGDPQKLIPFLRDIGGKSATALIPAFKDLEDLFANAPVWGEKTIIQLKKAKEDVLALADTFAGPLAKAIAFVAGQMDILFNGIKKQVAGAAAYWGGFTSSIDMSRDMTKWDYREANKDGLKAMEEAESVIEKEMEAKRKAFAERAARLKANPATAGVGGTGSVASAVADRIHNLGMRVIGDHQKPDGLTEWQRLGAAVRQEATTPVLKEISKNTEKTAERLDAIAKLYPKSGDGFGAMMGGGF